MQTFLKTQAEIDFLDPARYAIAIPHRNYPLVLYPNAEIWPGEARTEGKIPKTHFWGIKNTTDPETGRLIVAHCTVLENYNPSQEYVDGEFVRFGDSKCSSGINIIKGRHHFLVGVEVWAVGAPDIDKIYNAVQSFFEAAIEDE